jgi:hypothetical protein
LNQIQTHFQTRQFHETPDFSWSNPPKTPPGPPGQPQETLQKLQALGGEEEKAKRLKAATAAADAWVDMCRKTSSPVWCICVCIQIE